MNELISTESSESVRLAEAAARAAEADAERAKAEARIVEAKAKAATSSRRLQIIGVLVFFALFFGTLVIVHMTKAGVFN